MPGISFALADFVTGGPIVDLPIMEGATWATMLNRSDTLSCSVNLNDPDALALDLRSSTEPKKTMLIARNDDDAILAGGLISDRDFDEDDRTLTLNATGIRGGYFGKTIIGPASALTAPIVNVDGTANTALDTVLTGWSLGTIGKKLMVARLAWPGAPSAPFVLPADEVGTREREYRFVELKSVDKAITDLTNVVNGPDFAIDMQRAPDGISLLYVLRHGSEAEPRIGVRAGTWSLSGDTPISGLQYSDDGSDLASAAWMTAGRAEASLLASRRLNAGFVTSSGYPPMDYVDTSHNDVVLQTTLDGYNDENLDYASGTTRAVSFTVRADASPALGAYRPGDVVGIDVPPDHPYLLPFDVRITSISGDEQGQSVKIGCVILDA